MVTGATFFNLFRVFCPADLCALMFVNTTARRWVLSTVLNAIDGLLRVNINSNIENDFTTFLLRIVSKRCAWIERESVSDE